ncbi:helix-turn-helix transcriptional regulator [Methylobacterium sp. WL19]|uniref:helix-turn-helix domain-containing protein n=1 Tax=Methylobacterium sp. WL19 TaxID=2603896 RepID=UPI0016501343|nr:helix-turn-helix transcriptional regulator [Methylobacterium sp. WL19]
MSELTFSPDLISRLEDEAGLLQDEIAMQVGVSQPTVSRWKNGETIPRGQNERKLLQLVREKLMNGLEEGRVSFVPLVGFVGAGSEVAVFGDGQADPDEKIEAPGVATRDTVAVEIRGTSLGEFFDRWIVFYDDVRRPVTADLVGAICVCGLSDGRVLIKKIKNGSEDGLYHLHAQFEPPIYDAEVTWAAMVKHIRPR